MFKKLYSILLFTFFLMSSCKQSEDGTKLDAARGSNQGYMVTDNGKFEIQFYKEAFIDGMDRSFFGNRKGMSFKSKTGGIDFECIEHNYCKLDLDMHSEDFADTKYKYADGKAGFWALLIGDDAERFYEIFLTPWAKQNEKNISFDELLVDEFEKLVFINYDNVGQIYCKKRRLTNTTIQRVTNPKSHYACWFTYHDAFTDIEAARDYTRKSTYTAWESLDIEIEQKGLKN